MTDERHVVENFPETHSHTTPFHEYLDYLMQLHDKSADNLAPLVFVSPSYIRDWRRGKRFPGLHHIPLLLDALVQNNEERQRLADTWVFTANFRFGLDDEGRSIEEATQKAIAAVTNFRKAIMVLPILTNPSLSRNHNVIRQILELIGLPDEFATSPFVTTSGNESAILHQPSATGSIQRPRPSARKPILSVDGYGLPVVAEEWHSDFLAAGWFNENYDERSYAFLPAALFRRHILIHYEFPLFNDSIFYYGGLYINKKGYIESTGLTSKPNISRANGLPNSIGFLYTTSSQLTPPRMPVRPSRWDKAYNSYWMGPYLMRDLTQYTYMPDETESLIDDTPFYASTRAGVWDWHIANRDDILASRGTTDVVEFERSQDYITVRLNGFLVLQHGAPDASWQDFDLYQVSVRFAASRSPDMPTDAKMRLWLGD